MQREIRYLIVATLLAGCALPPASLNATSNHQYGANEYPTIVDGRSPDGKYAIATHGEGEYGTENFHVYLMNAALSKRIGPLEEIVETLDTGPDAFYARWPEDSSEVSIRYRIDRHEANEVRYRISKGRATLLSGPGEIKALRFK